jgi:hypothetical protein
VSSRHPSRRNLRTHGDQEAYKRRTRICECAVAVSKPRLEQPLYQDFATNGKTNVAFELAPSDQKLFNARTCGDSERFSFDEHGFCWLEEPTSLSHDDFENKEKLLIYHEEVAELLKRVTEADYVSIYSSGVSGSYV